MPVAPTCLRQAYKETTDEWESCGKFENTWSVSQENRFTGNRWPYHEWTLKEDLQLAPITSSGEITHHSHQHTQYNQRLFRYFGVNEQSS